MRRRLLLSLFGYGLLLLGLITLEGRLIALALVPLTYLVAALLTAPADPQLDIQRTLTTPDRFDAEAAPLAVERVSQTQPVTVRLTLTNRGSAIACLHVEDVVPQGLRVQEGAPTLLAPLAKDAEVTLTYTVTGERGSFDFHQVQITASDPLNLVPITTHVAVPARLFVLPESVRLPRLPLRPLRTHGYAGIIPSRQPGSGIDFYGVREYHNGDPRRQINWRVTARHGDVPYTNQFEQQRVADVGIILDAREQANLVTAAGALFEYSVRAAAALADVFLQDGHRVALLIYGRALERTYPGYGKVQRERILHALAQARTGNSMVFESFDYLPTRFFPSKSQIVLVSPLLPDDLPVLTRLRARGYALLVLSPDPVRFEAAALEQQGVPYAGLAARIGQLERTLLLRRLERFGAQVIDWPVDAPLDRIVQQYLAHKPRWPQPPERRL